MMNSNLPQFIYEKISVFLPIKFDEIIFYALDKPTTYKYEFYVKDIDGNFIKCYDLDNINDIMMLEAFESIRGFIKKDTQLKDKWDILTMSIKSDGQCDVDFEYLDEDFDEYEHDVIWKYKYLGVIPKEENKLSHSIVQKYISTHKKQN